MSKSNSQHKKILFNKKKELILVSILVVAVIILFIFLFRNRIFPKKQPENIEESIITEVNSSVVIDSGTTLNYEIFFKNEIDLKNINITFINQDESVSNRDLIIEDEVISSIGKYDVKIELDGKTYNSVLEVKDKTSPVLEVKDISINEGENIEVTSFVVSCKDNSLKECSYDFVDLEGNQVNLDLSIGTRKYIIIATDESDNETKKEVTLTVNKKESTPNNEVNTSNIASTRTITEETFEEAKYGAKYKITKTYKVTTYKDGTEDKKLTNTNKILDTSGFNATAKDMEAEARSVTNSNYNAYQEMTIYVNEYRAEVGSKELILDKELSVLATIRAIEISYSGKLDHNRPNGLGFYSVGEDMGYSLMILGENINYGSGGYNNTARKSATVWRNSEGHYQNMIRSGYGTIGVGKYTLNGKTYWVQLFCG